MMRAVVLLHRWLGVVFCLFFAMWFASGIVMHFVPFPTLSDAARVGGLAPLDLTALAHGPADAVAAGGIEDATRVRLLQRPDGPVYLVSGASGVVALHAADLSHAAVSGAPLALAIATDYARHWHLSFAAATSELTSYDQWTVSSAFDRHRPMFRIALDDGLGTEIYVSSRTGEIVLATTRYQRGWNYVGSVAHWIYPTVLRRHQAVWSDLVWGLSFAALIGAAAGAAIGVWRLEVGSGRAISPFQGWQALHHWLGLICLLFVLSWIFSGWLSMDDGLLFSSGNPTIAEATAITGRPAWDAVPDAETRQVAATAQEVEWFAFGSRIYRRERIGVDQQRLFLADGQTGAANSARSFLTSAEVDAAVGRLARACEPARAIDAADAYRPATVLRDHPIYRSVCGDVWFQIDGASGMVLEKLDRSRRVYRWLFEALHTLDFPVLTARPALRASLIVVLCGCGLAFSLTGVVIAWRRVMSCRASPF